jgi:fimbrial isopeptide formation D2 family protein
MNSLTDRIRREKMRRIGRLTVATWLVMLALLIAVGGTAAAQDQPPTFLPPQITKFGETCGDVGDRVTYTIVVTNPSHNSDGTPNQATWYNVRVIDNFDPNLRIEGATVAPAGVGTVTVTGNTLVVDGGITLAPGDVITITVVTTVLGYPSSNILENTACVEYTDATGAPQGEICTDRPVVIQPCTPVVPEASTLILLGTAATGLASYAGLQIRARRRSRS